MAKITPENSKAINYGSRNFPWIISSLFLFCSGLYWLWFFRNREVIAFYAESESYKTNQLWLFFILFFNVIAKNDCFLCIKMNCQNKRSIIFHWNIHNLTYFLVYFSNIDTIFFGKKKQQIISISNASENVFCGVNLFWKLLLYIPFTHYQFHTLTRKLDLTKITQIWVNHQNWSHGW